MQILEAFRALQALDEDVFDISAEGVKELSNFMDSDDIEDEVQVIDPEAEFEDDLQDSYVGKVILDCCVCHSKLYKDREEVTLDETGELANVGEDCPYCFTPDGFKVIGEVVAFDEKATEEDDEEAEVEESEEVEEVEEKTESLTESLKTKFVLEFEQMNGPHTAWFKISDDSNDNDADSWFTRNKKDATVFTSIDDARAAYDEYIVEGRDLSHGRLITG